MATVERILMCPPADAFGFDSRDLLGVVPAKCHNCETQVLRPKKEPRRVKPFCESCFLDYTAAARKDGADVREQERVVKVASVKRYKCRAGALVALAMVANHSAIAGDLDWMSKGQMSAVGHLAAGYAGALRCDRVVDAAVAGAFLSKTFGARSFSAQEVAAVGKVITGTIALQAVMIPADARSCATIRKAFGPGGTDIPGLLD